MQPQFEQAGAAKAGDDPEINFQTVKIVVDQQPHPPIVGPVPTVISCPHCQVKQVTRIEHTPHMRTHMIAALLCMMGFWCCVCLPYSAGSCMNANHFCGNCNQFVGVYRSD